MQAMIQQQHPKPLSVVMVTSSPSSFVAFSVCLGGEGDVKLAWATSGSQALELAAADPPDLMIVDDQLEEGLAGPELLRRLAALNWMINTAVASNLPRDEFRRTYAGLGTLAQVPHRPDRSHAQSLAHRLRQQPVIPHPRPLPLNPRNQDLA
jgi:CheY-like chemotaxis protein